MKSLIPVVAYIAASEDKKEAFNVVIFLYFAVFMVVATFFTLVH